MTENRLPAGMHFDEYLGEGLGALRADAAGLTLADEIDETEAHRIAWALVKPELAQKQRVDDILRRGVQLIVSDFQRERDEALAALDAERERTRKLADAVRRATGRLHSEIDDPFDAATKALARSVAGGLEDVLAEYEGGGSLPRVTSIPTGASRRRKTTRRRCRNHATAGAMGITCAATARTTRSRPMVSELCVRLWEAINRYATSGKGVYGNTARQNAVVAVESIVSELERERDEWKARAEKAEAEIAEAREWAIVRRGRGESS
jgi:hypothetical protein